MKKFGLFKSDIKMHNHIAIREIINNREYNIYGINAEIIACLDYNGVMAKILPAYEINSKILIRSLGSNSYSERVLTGKIAIRTIWEFVTGLGLHPLFELLSEFEFDRKFYSGYRDHVIHQLNVLLLGLYLFYSHEKMRTLLLHQFHLEDNFIKAWVICSLFHDIGYVFEFDDPTLYNHSRETLQMLEDIDNDPILHYLNSRKLSSLILKPQREKLLRDIGWRPLKMSSLENLCFTENGDSILSSIEDFISTTHLGNNKHALQNYFRYASSNTSKSGRPPFIDHGIASSIILIHYANRERQWRKSLDKLKNSLSLNNNVLQIFSGIHSEFETIDPLIEAATVAIALHNINPNLWDYDHAYIFNNFQLTLNTFCVHLSDLPLAYLLILADSIQDWDRPRYSSPNINIANPYEMQSQDIHILVNDDQINFFFPGDHLSMTNTDNSTFHKLLNNISDNTSNDGYINLNEIDKKKFYDLLSTINWNTTFQDKSIYTTNYQHGLFNTESIDDAYNWYKKGRTLANAGIWDVSAELHSKAARLFHKLNKPDWEARSLGRLAFLQLDMGKSVDCNDSLKIAMTLDKWQGAANYYWIIEHCIRGAEKKSHISDYVLNLIDSFRRLDFTTFDFSNDELHPNNSRFKEYIKISTLFFENIISREIRSEWPMWAMSDMARLYILKAYNNHNLADFFFKSAADAYYACDLSSYGTWMDCKVNLCYCLKISNIDSVNQCLLEIINKGVYILQNPGGSKDIVKFFLHVVSFIYNTILFYSSVQNTSICHQLLRIIESYEGESFSLIAKKCEAIIKDIPLNSGSTIIESDILFKIREVLSLLLVLENNIASTLITPCLK